MRSGPAFFYGSAVTWNPADKHADISLSGLNYVATRATGTSSYRSVRATFGKNYTDNGYFEVYISAMEVGGFQILGVATSLATLSNYVGSDANGWGYYGAEGGKKANNGVLTAYGANFAQGDVIGVAFKNGKLWFAKNNTWYGDPAAETGEAFSGITGTVFPIVSLYDAAVPVDSVGGRFGSAFFSYSPPNGFSAWG